MLSGIIGEDSEQPAVEPVLEQQQSASKKKKIQSSTNDGDNSTEKLKAKLMESFQKNVKSEEDKEDRKPTL